MKLLKLFEYYEQLLLEGKYDAMWSDYYQDLYDIFVLRGKKPRSENVFKNNIKDAKGSLKKQDRIVWYLRWVKVHMLATLVEHIESAGVLDAWQDYAKENNIKMGKGTTDILKSEKNKIFQRINKDLKKMKLNLTTRTIDRLPNGVTRDLETPLDHFLSLDIHKIDSYVFDNTETPDDLFRKFREYEDEWKETRKRLIEYDPDKEVFVKVSENLEWINLESPSCSLEGDAMGHCGNSPASHDSNQTILSLRERVDKDGTIWWKPHATFIYHKREKALGEMKGVYNKKPKKETHKAILKLILDKRIQKLVGGGYLAGSNFALTDLDDSLFDQILKKKPTLIDIDVFEEKFGFKETIKQFGKEKYVDRGGGHGKYFNEVGYEKFIKDFSKDDFAKYIGLRGYYEKEGLDKTIKEFGRDNFVESVTGGYDIYFNEYGLDKFIKDFSRELLIEEVGLNYYISEKGLDKFIIGELKSNGTEFTDNDKTIVLHEFKDMNDFVEDYGDETAQWVMGIISGDDHLDFDSTVDAQSIDYYISKEQEAKLKKYASEKYPEDYDASGDDWYDTLNDNSDELLDDEGIKQAYFYAEQSGTESQMYKALVSEYEDGMKGYRGDYIFNLLPEKFNFENPIQMTISTEYVESDAKDEGHYSIESLADHIESDLQEDPKFKVEQPHYGFQEFDEEYFKSEVDALLKDIK